MHRFRQLVRRTGNHVSTLYRVRDMDQFLRVRPTGEAESVGGTEGVPPSVREGPCFVVRKVPSSEFLGWKWTQKAAMELAKDLASLGVTCVVEPLEQNAILNEEHSE